MRRIHQVVVVVDLVFSFSSFYLVLSFITFRIEPWRLEMRSYILEVHTKCINNALLLS